MLDTLTRLQCWMPASRSASSKDWSCSLCLPTPFVKKKYFGIIAVSENMDCSIHLLVLCLENTLQIVSMQNHFRGNKKGELCIAWLCYSLRSLLDLFMISDKISGNPISSSTTKPSSKRSIKNRIVLTTTSAQIGRYMMAKRDLEITFCL